MGLGMNQLTTHQIGLRTWDDLEMSLISNEKATNFKPVSKASQVMKITPKAMQNQQKTILISSKFQHL